MAQYIDKNIVEEILRNLWKKDDGHNPEHRICYNKALQEVQCELDTIEVKDVDLVEEFADFLEKENAYVDDNNVISYYNGSSFNHTCDIYPIAKHFFELGLKAQKGE